MALPYVSVGVGLLQGQQPDDLFRVV